jgi:hypothetical protein
MWLGMIIRITICDQNPKWQKINAEIAERFPQIPLKNFQIQLVN